MKQSLRPEHIVDFWRGAGAERWFVRSPEFDGQLRRRFASFLAQARSGVLDDWQDSPNGALALVILLDQFSRNIHRGTPLMFAADGRALRVAKKAIAGGYHWAAPPTATFWLIMPFEHAEDLDAQWRGLGLFETMGLSSMVHWAKLHLDVIARFGRFPHRNSILGRPSTPAELRFLAEGGFSA